MTARKPNLLSRLWRALSPAGAAGDSVVSMAAGAYDAAVQNRLSRVQDMVQYSSRAAAGDRATLVNMSRACTRNNPLGAAIKNAYLREITGKGGITSSATATDPYTGTIGKDLEEFNKRCDDLWAEHCRRPDWYDLLGVCGDLDALRQVVGERVEAGQVFIVWGYQRQSDHVGLTIHTIEVEQLDTSAYLSSRGNRVLDGIEVDKDGRKLFYHFYRYGPTDEWPYDHTTIEVPAAQVWQVYHPDRPRQVHGLPLMASSLELLHYLKGYAENTAIAAMFQACYMMQLKRSAGVGDYAPPGGSLPNDTTTSTTDGGGNRKFFMQPGMVFDDLPPETELDLIAPTQPQGVFNDFIKAVSAMSATGAGLDVHRLLRDYSGGNYSSLHLASLDFDKQCSVEDQLYISTWRRRHRALWTELAILEGRLPVRREFYTDPAWRSAYLRADHRSQKRERVDPRADAAADAMDLKNMTKSLPQLVNEWGGDYRENLRSWTESELARVEGKAQIIDRAIERAAVLGVDYHELLPDAPARPLPTGAGRPAESPETATATEGEESDDQRRDG